MDSRESLVHAVAALTDDELADVLDEARGATADPKERAAKALRRSSGRNRKASKESAAEAIRQYRRTQ